MTRHCLRYWSLICCVLLACTDSAGPASHASLAAIATGSTSNYHTCAVTLTAAVYCWGTDSYGELGTGRVGHSVGNPPRPVQSRITFSSVGVGETFSCALASDGAAYCWGDNFYGQVGNGHTRGMDSFPVPVVGGLNFVSISVGRNHTCAMTAGGSAYCWGEVPGIGASATPVAVTGGLQFRSLSAGVNETCGITTTALTYCWGWTDSLPVVMSSAPALVSISVGAHYTCGLTGDGTAYCWGLNGYGQLGNGRFTPSESKAGPVAGQLRFSSIDAGIYHTCAVSVDGDAYCWGSNLSFAVGDPTIGWWAIPRLVTGGLKFRRISAGEEYTCAVSVDDAGYCWGANSYNRQLGAATRAGSLYRPQRIIGF